MKSSFSAIGAATVLAVVLLSGCATTGSGDAVAEVAQSTTKESTAPETAEAAAPSEEEVVESTAEAQSAVAACNIMFEPVNALATLNTPEQMAAMQADPASALTVMNDAATSVRAAAETVTNPEIAPAATAAADSLADYADFLVALSADPAAFDAAEFGDQVGAFTGALMGLQTACTS